MRKAAALFASLALGFLTTPAHAAFVINVQEIGSNVVAFGNGSFNLRGLHQFGSNLCGYSGEDQPIVSPSDGVIVIGGGACDIYDQGIVGPDNMGPSSYTRTDVYTGGLVGIAPGQLIVPAFYRSGDHIGSTATFLGATIASLGLISGTYVWDWGSGDDADSLTVVVATPTDTPPTPTAPLPEPGAWLMLLAGFGAMGGALRRRSVLPARVRFV